MKFGTGGLLGHWLPIGRSWDMRELGLLIEMGEFLEEGNSDCQKDEDVDGAADILGLVHHYEIVILSDQLGQNEMVRILNYKMFVNYTF
jgi:hypothetical protein